MPGKCYKNLSDQAIVLVQNKDVKSGKICCSLEKMCVTWETSSPVA